jgi:hypothetical protein
MPTAFAVKPSLNVEPAIAIVQNVGEEKTVNITVKDISDPKLFSYELKLYYNTTYLEVVGAEIPTGHFLTPTIKPGNIFIVDSGTNNTDAGYVSFAATLLAPEEGKTGSGVLCTVTFRGKALGVSTLELRDVILVDSTATEFPGDSYDIYNGSIEVIPEFSTAMLAILLVIASLYVIALKRKVAAGIKSRVL